MSADPGMPCITQPKVIPMKHASGPALEALAPLLAELRAMPGLVERKPGIFYFRSAAFLHFHEDAAGLFADVLKADPAMDALITRARAPYETRLAETLAVTDGLLYRRGNFNGSWDQLLCDALIDVQGAQIAFSPGFRWGSSLLPGDTITRETLMDQVAISYPPCTLNDMTGEQVKTVLEDVADNLFNPDPYYQQGGDMVRVGGLEYTITPSEKMGARISGLRLGGKPLHAGKAYKVANWAPVAESARGGKPVWELLESWLKAQPGGRVGVRQVNAPTLLGVQGNPGLA